MINLKAERRWTHAEVEYLYEFAENQGVGRIAEELNRSTDSVKEMLATFRLPIIDIKAPTPVSKKLRQDLWSASEMQFLKDNWQSLSTEEIVMHLKRPYTGLLHKARSLGLPRRNKVKYIKPAQEFLPYRAWTQEDDQFIQENWLTMGIAEIACLLKREIGTLKNRANKLGCQRKSTTYLHWSVEETEYFKHLWQTKSSKEVAIIIGKPERRARLIAEALGLTVEVVRSYTRWTEEERAYVMKFYSTKSQKEIAQILGKTTSGVEGQYHKIRKGLTPKTGSYPMLWSQEECQYLKDNYLKQHSKSLASNLNRPFHAVQFKLKQLGLTRPKNIINRLRETSLDDISDERATFLISHDPELRREALRHPQLLKFTKAQFILNRKIRQV